MKPKFVECGCCGHWHPVDWYGDCRDDAHRFSTSDLEDKYGPQDEGWIGLEIEPEDDEPVYGLPDIQAELKMQGDY